MRNREGWCWAWSLRASSYTSRLRDWKEENEREAKKRTPGLKQFMTRRGNTRGSSGISAAVCYVHAEQQPLLHTHSQCQQRRRRVRSACARGSAARYTQPRSRQVAGPEFCDARAHADVDGELLHHGTRCFGSGISSSLDCRSRRDGGWWRAPEGLADGRRGLGFFLGLLSALALCFCFW